MSLRETLQNAFAEAATKNPKWTPYQAAKIGGTNYSNFKDALEGKRSFSDEMLMAVAKCGFLPFSYETLRQWKGLDEFPELQNKSLPLPYYGKVPAGGFRLMLQDDVGVKEWPKPVKGSKEGLFLLGIEGNSMEPAYPDGSLLLCRQVQEYRNNHRYIVETVDGETTFKLLKLEDGGLVTLIPVNEHYQPFTVARDRVVRIYEIVDHWEETE